jgi:hypothetical protein
MNNSMHMYTVIDMETGISYRRAAHSIEGAAEGLVWNLDSSRERAFRGDKVRVKVIDLDGVEIIFKVNCALVPEYVAFLDTPLDAKVIVEPTKE